MLRAEPVSDLLNLILVDHWALLIRWEQLMEHLRAIVSIVWLRSLLMRRLHLAKLDLLGELGRRL